MPPFNPSIPQAPDYPYINYGREISEPKPDTSKEIALKGAASALTTGVEAIDTSIKMGASKEIYSQVDPVQEERVQSLQNQYQTLLGRDPTQTHPQDLKNLPGQIDKLHSARDAGKLTQIDTDARLNSIAKTIRAKYPGYREYVDEIFEKATGRTPANKLAAALSQGINELESENKSAKDRTLTKAYSALNQPGMAANIEAYKAGKMSEAALLQNINDYEAADHALEMGIKKREALAGINKLGADVAKDSAKASFGDSSTTKIHASMNSLFARSGWGDADKLQKAFDDLQKGNRPGISGEEASRMALFANQSRAALKSQLVLDGTRTYSPGGRSTQDDLGGPEELEKEVEAHLKLHFDQVMDALAKGEFALANSNKIILQGKSDDKLGAMLDNKKVTEALVFNEAIHKFFPGLGGAVSALQFELPAQLQPLFGVDAANAVNTKPDADGLKKKMEDARIKGVKDGKYYKGMIDIHAKFGDKDIPDEAADALIKNTFSNANKGLLAMFDKDKRLPNGQLVPGQEWIWNTFSAEKMAKRVWKRGQEKPELWENYVEQMNNDFSTVLFPDQLNVMKSAIADYPEVKIGFDNEKHQFKVSPPGPESKARSDVGLNKSGNWFDTSERTGSSSTETYYGGAKVPRRLQDAITKLNKGLSGLSNIYKQDPRADTNLEILRLLSITAPSSGSLEEQMINAVRAAHQ